MLPHVQGVYDPPICIEFGQGGSRVARPSLVSKFIVLLKGGRIELHTAVANRYSVKIKT